MLSDNEGPERPIRRTPVSITYKRRTSSQYTFGLATPALKQTPSTEEWEALFTSSAVPRIPNTTSPAKKDERQSPAKGTRTSPRKIAPPWQPTRTSPRKSGVHPCNSDTYARKTDEFRSISSMRPSGDDDTETASTPQKRKCLETASPWPRRSPRIQAIEKKEIPVSRLFPIFLQQGRGAIKPKQESVAPGASVTSSTTKPPAQKTSDKHDGKPEARSARSKAPPTQKQLIMDVGQRSLGFKICEECGMGYSAGVKGDEQAHARHHAAALREIPFPGWKTEDVVREYEDGSRVICASRRNEPRHVKKVEQIREVVDQELGFATTADSALPDTYKVYLMIADKKVAGCCVAEPLRQAFPLLITCHAPPAAPCEANALGEAKRPSDAVPFNDTTICASTTPEPAVLGISRIWVSRRMRRRNVATRLVDAARTTFLYGQCVPLHLVAFSQPTADGKAFAAHYTGRPGFLVY